jgi:hypothetical protein
LGGDNLNPAPPHVGRLDKAVLNQELYALI